MDDLVTRVAQRFLQAKPNPAEAPAAEDRDSKDVTPERLADLLVFVNALGALDDHVRQVRAVDPEPGPGLDNLRRLERSYDAGRTLLVRYGREVQAGMERHLLGLATRPGAAGLKPVANRLKQPGSPLAQFIKYRSFSTLLFPWLRAHQGEFRDTFTGRAYRVALMLTTAMSEEAPLSRLNKMAAIPTISAMTITRNWVVKAAEEAGVPLSATEATLADAESVQAVAEDLRQTKAAVEAADPMTDRAAELHGQRQELVARAEEIVASSKEPQVVLSTVAATAAQPESPTARKFNLTPEQEDVMRTMGKVVVAAGAGSGKTATLTATIAHLVNEKGYDPGQILACSFTIAASSELEARVVDKGGVQGCAIGTTHKVARFIIDQHRPDLSQMIRKTRQAEKCFPMAMKQVEMDVAGFDAALEKNKALMRDIEAVPGWRSNDKLTRGYDALAKGQVLSEKWEQFLRSEIRRSTGGGYGGGGYGRGWSRRWAENEGADKTAAPTFDDESEEAPAEPPEAKGTGEKSPFYTIPAKQWFNLGQKLVDEKKKPLSLKGAKLLVENFQNSGLTVEAARQQFGDTPMVALYGAYEWLKKNAKPLAPCADFNDQLSMALDILKTSPEAREQMQASFKVVLVDEAQDLNQIQFEMFQILGAKADLMAFIGDDKQCLARSSMISVPSGKTPLSDMAEGDPILSYRNSQIVAQRVRHVQKSPWTWGYKVTTESGKTLTMSPNHKLWATEPILAENEHLVYLMYRRDLGFRVGITCKGGRTKRGQDYYDSLAGRAFMERAERMWVLEICSDREAALLAETSYSLAHRIPTCVFNGTNRGLNQSRLNTVFERFGQNGKALLAERHLSFDLPHWISQGYTKHDRGRHVVQFLAHTAQGTQVTLEWEGDVLDACLEGLPPSRKGGVFSREGERRRLRRYFPNYREAAAFADDLAARTGAVIVKRLATPEGNLRHLTASALFPGMAVPTEDGEGGIVLETITAIERVEDEFVDLDVDDASNFFAGGILSHNSIYAFRGARPKNYVDLTKVEGFQTRLMTTNFRSGSAIVDAANKLIAHNGDRQIPMTCQAHAKRGVGGIKAIGGETHESAANEVASLIKDAVDSGASPQEYGILVRNNAEADAYTLALLSRGVPYRMLKKDQGGYFGRPIVKALTSWMRLVVGGTKTQINDALLQAHRTPGFGLDEEFETQLARKAIGMSYLDFINQGREVYNPMRDTSGREQPNWRNRNVLAYGEAIRQARILGRMESASLIKAILDIKGPKGGTFEDALVRMIDREEAGETDEVTEDQLREMAMAPIRPILMMADNFRDPENLLAFIQKMKDANERVQKATPEKKEDWKEPAVLVGTVHGWKGLQAKHCFVCMAGGVFPNFRSEEQSMDDATAFDEERRLAYVAVTRGEDTVTVVCPGASYLGKPAGFSRFVNEACIPVEGDPGEELPPAGGDAPIAITAALVAARKYEANERFVLALRRALAGEDED